LGTKGFSTTTLGLLAGTAVATGAELGEAGAERKGPVTKSTKPPKRMPKKENRPPKSFLRIPIANCKEMR
jgi:hypothetical protein